MCDEPGEYDLAILCGGEGQRMGGRDKGLLSIPSPQRQVTFVETLVERLRCPGLNDTSVIISANRNLDTYQRLPGIVIADRRQERVGPLGGMESVLTVASSQRPLVIVPCDMPLLPAQLPLALISALNSVDSIAVLHDGLRRQPLCLALYPGRWRTTLSNWLDSGGRSVYRWLQDKPTIDVLLSESESMYFANINHPHDYAGVRAQAIHIDKHAIPRR